MPIILGLLPIVAIVILAGLVVFVLLSPLIWGSTTYIPSYRQYGDWRIEWSLEMHQPLIYLVTCNGNISVVWEEAYVDICGGQVDAQLFGPGEIRITNHRKVVTHKIRSIPATK